MKTTKRLFVSFLIVIFAMSTITGCGSKSAPGVSSTELINSEGEGPVQGGIKSDEEISKLQEEEQQYTEDEEPTIEYAENVDNTGHEPDSYISADNFWQGDFFDLENYLYMNGALWIRKGSYDHTTGELIESEDNVSVFKTQFSDIHWLITITSPSEIDFEFIGYEVDGETYFGPYYLVTQNTPYEDQYMVPVNNGMQLTNTTIETLDDMIHMAKEYRDTDNPFQNSEKYNRLYNALAHNEAPSNAVLID